MKNKKEKDNRQKKKQEEEKKAKRDIENLIEQAEEQLGVDRSKLKVVRVNTQKRTLKLIFFEALFVILINLFLILSISGYLHWADYQSILDLVWFVLIFSAVELLLKNFLYLFFSLWIIKTFGLILFLPTLIAIPIVIGIIDFLVIVSIARLIIMFLLLFFIRTILKNILMQTKRG